jgi:hypothetical protein
MHPIGEPPSASTVNRVAGLVRSLEHPESLPAILEHLGHEGELVHAAVFVQCSQNFLFAPDFHQIAGSQFHIMSYSLIHE